VPSASPLDFSGHVVETDGVKNTHHVIIVGGGPVGLALALTLSARDISCALIEARTEMHRIPKGQNLTQRTLEHFYFWGIADKLRRARVMPPDAPIGEITAYGDLASDYWHAPRGRARRRARSADKRQCPSNALCRAACSVRPSCTGQHRD